MVPGGMMLVAVASFKGSPMVTSFAVALAARWPVPGAIVMEADPAGGDLAPRFRLSRHPGLRELADASTTGADALDLGRYTARLPLGVDVIPTPGDIPEEAGRPGPGSFGGTESAVR